MSETIGIHVVGKLGSKPVYKCKQGYFIGVANISIVGDGDSCGWACRNGREYIGYTHITGSSDVHSAFKEACELVLKHNGELRRHARFKNMKRDGIKTHLGVIIPTGMNVSMNGNRYYLLGVPRNGQGIKVSKCYPVHSAEQLKKAVETESLRQHKFAEERDAAARISLEEACLIFKERPEGITLK